MKYIIKTEISIGSVFDVFVQQKVSVLLYTKEEGKQGFSSHFECHQENDGMIKSLLSRLNEWPRALVDFSYFFAEMWRAKIEKKSKLIDTVRGRTYTITV